MTHRIVKLQDNIIVTTLELDWGMIELEIQVTGETSRTITAQVAPSKILELAAQLLNSVVDMTYKG